MTDIPPSPPSPGGPESAADRVRLDRAEKAIRGLGREVEAAIRAQAQLVDKTALIELKGSVAELAEMITELANSVSPDPPARRVVSWFTQHDPDTANAVLTDLVDWLHVVYLGYADAAMRLPECWLWHPEIVEELLCLQQAWQAAYTGNVVRNATDWQDRLRPGVTRRLASYLPGGECSLEHHYRAGLLGARDGDVPTADAAPGIAGWWAADRDTPAPEPTEAQLRAALAALNRRTRRGTTGPA